MVPRAKRAVRPSPSTQGVQRDSPLREAAVGVYGPETTRRMPVCILAANLNRQLQQQQSQLLANCLHVQKPECVFPSPLLEESMPGGKQLLRPAKQQVEMR